MQYVDLRPNNTRFVWLQVPDQADEWLMAELEAHRHRHGAWEGRVRCSEGAGLQRIDWVPGDRIRRGAWVG